MPDPANHHFPNSSTLVTAHETIRPTCLTTSRSWPTFKARDEAVVLGEHELGQQIDDPFKAQVLGHVPPLDEQEPAGKMGDDGEDGIMAWEAVSCPILAGLHPLPVTDGGKVDLAP